MISYCASSAFTAPARDANTMIFYSIKDFLSTFTTFAKDATMVSTTTRRATNAPAANYKCSDYHQNDGAKGAAITNATSTVAGYLPAARKKCPTTLADRASNKQQGCTCSV
jgi:hypothetical protein